MAKTLDGDRFFRAYLVATTIQSIHRPHRGKARFSLQHRSLQHRRGQPSPHRGKSRFSDLLCLVPVLALQ